MIWKTYTDDDPESLSLRISGGTNVFYLILNVGFREWWRYAARAFLVVFLMGNVAITLSPSLAYNSYILTKFSWFHIWLFHAFCIDIHSGGFYLASGDWYRRFAYSLREMERNGLVLYLLLLGPRSLLRTVFTVTSTSTTTSSARSLKFKFLIISVRVIFLLSTFPVGWVYVLSKSGFDSSGEFIILISFVTMVCLTGVTIGLELAEAGSLAVGAPGGATRDLLIRGESVVSDKDNGEGNTKLPDTELRLPGQVAGDDVSTTKVAEADVLNGHQFTTASETKNPDEKTANYSSKPSSKQVQPDLPSPGPPSLFINVNINVVPNVNQISDANLTKNLVNLKQSPLQLLNSVSPKFFLHLISIYFVLMHSVVFSRVLMFLQRRLGAHSLLFISWIITYTRFLAS